MKQDSELDQELLHVAREKGTEAPFTGKYVDEHAEGMYVCAVCGNELFSSDTKFDSGTGWPAFGEPSAGKPSNVVLTEDTSHGMIRMEVTCKNCGAHLGHV